MTRPRWGWKTALALAVLAAALILFFALRPSGPGSGSAAAGAPAPDFSYPDLSGKRVALSSFKGQVVFLDFWATWCDPCREEIPDLIKLHEAYKSRGFTVLGAATDANGEAVVAPFVRENKMPYPVLVTGGELPDGYPIPGFPTAFLIGRDGRVVQRYLGGYPFEELSHDVEAALVR